jgi:hypothetical protein
MDFDSIISLFFIFIFFILPVLLKKFQTKKRPGVKTAPAKKKASLFERMGEQIQDFVKDLEQQAMAGKEAAEKKDGIWERLAEDEKPDAGSLDMEAPVHEKTSMIKDQGAPQKMESRVQKGFKKEREVPVEKPGGTETYALNSRQKLRQAFVWSEILAKPLALREKH